MRKLQLLLLTMLLISAGCEWVNKNFHDRLLFVEESHIGLKAKVGIDHTPGDIDFGYRRSVLALIPKADAEHKGSNSAGSKPPDSRAETVNKDCPPDQIDSKEPLSVISSFNADVRWFEATRIRTYFATGEAAAQTACDVHAIKDL